MPLYLFHKIVFLNSNKSFTTISELLSLFPGYTGYFIRRSFYRLALKTGKNLDINFGTILQYPSIRIAENVYIGQNCNIAKSIIKKETKIGSSVHIVNKYTHKIKKGEILPTDINKLKPISIGENTWIGNNSVILADIGDNCIIGAGAVVTKPIPDNSVAVGNPAKVIRKNI